MVPAGTPWSAYPELAHLLIEVSFSSRRYDLALKAAVYDAAGVPECWVIDLVERVVHRHCEPTGSGYGSITQHRTGETLSSCGVVVDLSKLLSHHG